MENQEKTSNKNMGTIIQFIKMGDQLQKSRRSNIMRRRERQNVRRYKKGIKGEREKMINSRTRLIHG